MKMFWYKKADGHLRGPFRANKGTTRARQKARADACGWGKAGSVCMAWGQQSRNRPARHMDSL